MTYIPVDSKSDRGFRGGPHGYTHGHGEAVLRSHSRRTAAGSLAYVLPYLTAGSSVLDVGCGPGSVTLDLAGVVAGLGGAASQVTGVENTPVPLRAAVAAAAARGLGARFMEGDIYHLPFAAGSFDVVVAHQVFQHLTDPVAAMRECLRVTAPGGVVAVRDADYSAMSWYPELPGMSEWSRGYRAAARADGAEPDGGRHLLRWALEAGCDLRELTYTVSTWVYSHAPGGSSAEEFAADWSDRVREDRFRRQLARVQHSGDGDFDADCDGDVDAAVERICEGWRQWADDPSAVFVMPHGELLVRR